MTGALAFGHHGASALPERWWNEMETEETRDGTTWWSRPIGCGNGLQRGKKAKWCPQRDSNPCFRLERATS